MVRWIARTKTSNGEVSPLWQQVVDHFKSWVKRSVDDLSKRKWEKKAPNLEHIVKRFVSSALALGAFSPDYVLDRNDLCDWLLVQLDRALPGDWMERLEARWRNWKASGFNDCFSVSGRQFPYPDSWDVLDQPGQVCFESQSPQGASVPPTSHQGELGI